MRNPLLAAAWTSLVLAAAGAARADDPRRNRTITSIFTVTRTKGHRLPANRG